ncbi:MAG: retroviral-like aspartic protease family protein [Gemmataceae bacterium]|nr:retroviral-like aspartic protease family protein [Gemmataceae bacterium]
MVVDIRVNVAGATMHAALAAGQVPPSVPAQALIDTGTDVTAVAPALLRRLGARVVNTTTTQGISGSVQVRLFLVTLFVLDAGRPHLPWLTAPDLLVLELPGPLAFDVLIGLDILRTCRLFLDGPGQQFTLDF